MREGQLLVGAALMAAILAAPAGAEEADTPEVLLTCRMERQQAMLALHPGPGVRISAELGVRVSPTARDGTRWGMRLPAELKEDTGYFPGAVMLTLPIARAAARPSLRVDYGYCTTEGVCMADAAEVQCD